VNALSDGLSADDLQAVRGLLAVLRERLERADRDDTGGEARLVR
jgi:hypothetical protein